MVASPWGAAPTRRVYPWNRKWFRHSRCDNL